MLQKSLREFKEAFLPAEHSMEDYHEFAQLEQRHRNQWLQDPASPNMDSLARSRGYALLKQLSADQVMQEVSQTGRRAMPWKDCFAVMCLHQALIEEPLGSYAKKVDQYRENAVIAVNKQVFPSS